MKVLFVSSGNIKGEISPIVKSQGESLKSEALDIKYYAIIGHGLWSYLKSIKSLKKVLRSRKCDIIHAHYGFSAIVAFFAKSSNEKLIVSFMGDDICGSNDINGKILFKSRLFVLLNRYFAKHHYNMNIVKSKEMFSILNVANSIVIPNGVDFNKFYEIEKEKPHEFGIKIPNTKKILFCANPKRAEKNFSLAVKAVDFINEEKIELISVHGVEQDQLVKYYNSVDCLILTSFHEGSPNVIKEAMACNLPIVSTKVGDVEEIIKDTNGCYIASYEVKDVADKIRKAISFDARTTGRKDILHLESREISKKIMKLYLKILTE